MLYALELSSTTMSETESDRNEDSWSSEDSVRHGPKMDLLALFTVLGWRLSMFALAYFLSNTFSLHSFMCDDRKPNLQPKKALKCPLIRMLT